MNIAKHFYFLLFLIGLVFSYLPAYSQTTADSECKTFCVETLNGLGYTEGRALPNAQSGSCNSSEDEKEVCCCSPKREN